MKNFKLLTVFLSLIAMGLFGQNFGGLPIWPESIAATDYLSGIDDANLQTTIQNPTPHYVVNWENDGNVVPIPNTLPTGSTDNWAATQAGFNDCGKLTFYAIHTGDELSINQLEIYNSNGQLLLGPSTNPAAPNAGSSDDEIQIVKRPGFSNQWYLIYSSRDNEKYNCVATNFSLIKILNNVASYVQIGGVIQKDIPLLAPATGSNNGVMSARLYVRGKAVSKTNGSVTSPGHFLFLHRRFDQGTGTRPGINDGNFSIDKFNITSNGISWVENSGWIATYSENLSHTAVGSPMELSPDEKTLAVMMRTATRVNDESIYLFDVTQQLSSNPSVIQFDQLLVRPDVANQIITGYSTNDIDDFSTYSQVNTLGNSGGYLSFLANFEFKQTACEFSFNGRFLYLTGGGYVPGSSGNGYLSYLTQIDLESKDINNNYVAAIHVQRTSGWDATASSRSTGQSAISWKFYETNIAHQAALYNFNPIRRIQSCFDGNLYFTKARDTRLYVIPNSDEPMKSRLIPYDVDLGTDDVPNIQMNGFVYFLPDQIDGFDYSGGNFTDVEISFNYSEPDGCVYKCVDFTVQLLNKNGDVVNSETSLDCNGILTMCTRPGESYDLLGSNGVRYNDVIVDGQFNTTLYTSSFDFTTEELGDDNDVEISVHSIKMNGCEETCEDFDFYIYSALGTEDVQTTSECNGTITICPVPGVVYYLKGQDGVIISNIYSDGKINYPEGQDYFEFRQYSQTAITLQIPFEYKTAVDCEMECTATEVLLKDEEGNIVAFDKSSECGVVEVCVDRRKNYSLSISGNTVSFTNAIVGGKVLLPDGEELFNFTTEFVSELTCCPLNKGFEVDHMIFYTKDVTISENTVWDHKIYVSKGVTVTIDGAILDVTNTDVIFGECAGLEFINNATIRSTNSVYRPCEIDDIWKGLLFKVSATSPFYGFMNTSTIKNATYGIAAEGTSNEMFNVRITNNTFINCFRGVSLGSIHMKTSITGNTFNKNDLFPTFMEGNNQFVCEVPGSAVSYPFALGINADRVSFEGLISTNNFIRTDDGYSNANLVTSNEDQFYGIVIRNRGVNDARTIMSNNVFENNTVGVVVFKADDISIMNNTFSYSIVRSNLQVSTESSKQIFFNQVNYARIFGNEIVNNSDEETGSSNDLTGVFLFKSNIINIKENEISNFETGVFITRGTNMNISDNLIKNSDNYGIALQDCNNNVSVSCNVIDNHLRNNGVTTIGIGVIDVSAINGSNTSEIKSNCIYECTTALHFESANGNQGPQVRNNFLYNYTRFGVNAIGMDLSNCLGTDVSALNSGTNSFVSNNNSNGATDVRSTIPISIYGNYGSNVVSVEITANGLDDFSSSASCAGQIGSELNQINNSAYCDRLTGNELDFALRAYDEEDNGDVISLKPLAASEVEFERVVINEVKLTVYPVPAMEYVNFEIVSNVQDATLKIYGMDGKLLETRSDLPNYSVINVDLSVYAKGAYFVTLSTNNEVIDTVKFIKR